MLWNGRTSRASLQSVVIQCEMSGLVGGVFGGVYYIDNQCFGAGARAVRPYNRLLVYVGVGCYMMKFCIFA